MRSRVGGRLVFGLGMVFTAWMRLWLSMGSLALGATLWACAPSIEEIETTIKTQVEQKGGKVKSVACPKDQKLDDGVEFVCKVTLESGDESALTVKRVGDTVAISGTIRGKESGGESEKTAPSSD